MLTGKLFLARPSVAQMSNDEHLLGVSGAAGVLAVAQQVSLSETCRHLVLATHTYLVTKRFGVHVTPISKPTSQQNATILHQTMDDAPHQ